MNVLPTALLDVIEALGSLPGVGPRTAERYAYFLLKNQPDVAKRLSGTIEKLHSGVSYCKKTFALIESGQEISELYSNPSRNKQQIAIVADPFDIVALEKTSQFRGTYHVLGGLISPIDGIGPDQLHIDELVKRIDDDKVNEIIMATNASVEGESTALYVQKQIGDRKLKITRLARGLPVGVDLEYADLITLGRALEGRTAV